MCINMDYIAGYHVTSPCGLYPMAFITSGRAMNIELVGAAAAAEQNGGFRRSSS